MSESIPGARLPEQAQFTRPQICRMLGISERLLKAWERQGWIQPSPTALPDTTSHPPRPAVRGRLPPTDTSGYSFSDIVTLRTLLRLRQNGVSSRRLRLLHATLKERLAKAGVNKRWSELPIHSHGKRVSIYLQGTRMEPLTGQLLFDYPPEEEKTKIRPIAPTRPNRLQTQEDRNARAERLFLAGLRYEERAATIPKAIRAYQKAIELNPGAIGAFLNLGTIHYNLGRLSEAESCYRAALAINPRYALVHFNLANLFDEKGEWEKARQHYEEAIRLDPNYPDPRYNLALVYEKLGRHGKAWQQWRGYLKLDSESPWASHARKKLEQVPLRVVSPRKLPGDGP